MPNMFDIFRSGALTIATEMNEYTGAYEQYGLSRSEWQTLTKREVWTRQEAKSVRSLIAELIQISLTISGLPAQQLPGQYVAAVIATAVAPVNWLAAAARAPQCFDAVNASGLSEEHEVREMPMEQMQSLVIAYGGHATLEPIGHHLPNDVQDSSTKVSEE